MQSDRLVAERLERADRSSTLELWAAARAAGAKIYVIDEGDIAVAAAPDLPGPIFNTGLGFTMQPDGLDRALAHFARHGVTGWVWTDAPPPWPDAKADARSVYAGAATADLDSEPDVDDGIGVRELRRDEVEPFAEVMIGAVEFDSPMSVAWRGLWSQLARAVHTHRFVAAVDGTVVGTGVLHTHRGVGWLRAGTVLPAYRGRGVHRRLLAARIDAARRLGCDLVGASAEEGSTSARNLERMGLRVVARRARYRVASSA